MTAGNAPNSGQNADPAAAIGAAAGVFAAIGIAVGGLWGVAVVVVVAAILEILDCFGIFGGGQAPIILNGYYRMVHHIYSFVTGAPYAFTPDQEASSGREAAVVEVRFTIPHIPGDPNESFHPGEGWEPRPKGNWANPGAKQGLHPDPNEEFPKGPHFDWHLKNPKRTFSIRNKGGNLQFWDEDLQEWLDTIPGDLPEMMIP